MVRKYKVNISRAVIESILEKAKAADKDLRARRFVSSLDKYAKEGRLSLSPKQFVYLCAIAGEKPQDSLYTVSKRSRYKH